MPFGIIFFCKSMALNGLKTCSFYLELKLHGLEGGGGLDAPGAGILGDVHGRGGHGGGLPQQEAHVQSLEELLVLVSRGPGVTSLESVHLCRLIVV